jgi:hypothetical protein
MMCIIDRLQCAACTRLRVHAQLVAFLLILLGTKTLLAMVVVALDDPIEVCANFLFLPVKLFPDVGTFWAHSCVVKCVTLYYIAQCM